MEILLVEDDEFKQTAIMGVIEALSLPVRLHVEKSVQAAIESLNNNKYQIILLDMALPSHNLVQGKGAPVSMLSGGMEVIMEIGYLKRSEAIIVLTQYPEIEIDNKLYTLEDAKNKIVQEYEVRVEAVIRFKRERDDWRQLLSNEIRALNNENINS